ncbi:MAG: hypothetical protein K0Q59_1124 [Paenibacillus sp.]|jgi:hypothetical protein|nr:hypothetical protein [Paenibacillus sp.]
MNHEDIVMLGTQSAGMGEEGRQQTFATVDVYDFPEAPLDRYIALIIPGQVDQELLLKHKDKIRRFLDSGKVLLFGGHLFRPWLPGAGSFVPKQIRTYKDYGITFVGDHPIFAGVDPDDLVYNKGVAGFFARGHHPHPQGVEILLTLPDGEPTLYIDRVSTHGTMMISSGSTLLNYRDPAKSSGRIAERIIEWIRQEHAQLQQRSAV